MGSAISSVKPAGTPDPIPVPKFLVELEPRHRVFFGNLRDLVWPRRLEPLELTSIPAVFWPDVMVPNRFPLRGLFDSIAGHVLVLVSVLALAEFGWLGSRPQQLRNPMQHTIVYYSVADYLPEVNSGSEPAKVELKGQPAYSKQEIISVPPEPDNTRQTIVTPTDIKLNHSVQLPNIVSWNAAIPAAPMSATPGKKINLALQPSVVAPPPEPVSRPGAISLPSELLKVTAVAPPVDALSAPTKDLTKMRAEVVAPAADPTLASARSLSKLQMQPNVVAPAAEINLTRTNRPKLATPSVVEPAAELAQAPLRPGAINMARMTPQVSEPKMPVPQQRALGVGEAAGGGGAPGSAVTPGGAAGSAGAAGGADRPVASAPSIEGIGSGRSSGQLIALGLDPVEVKGPIEVPAGNRRGVFAASPSGIPGAPGTPDIHKGADGGGGAGTAKGAGPGSGSRTSAEGIFVGRGSAQPPDGAVVARKPGDAPTRDPGLREKLMAAARAPDIGRQPSPGTTVDAGDRKIEEKVFGPKRYYTLTLNMPNLNSTTGSWVIRFAELKQSHDGVAVAAPAVLTKVDPAYPADLVRDKVEGTVVLYAVIHSDGSVGEIRVLSGVEERLDKNASKALAAWKFQPGTKNGEAVDLEAVVQIPFKVRKSPF